MNATRNLVETIRARTLIRAAGATIRRSAGLSLRDVAMVLDVSQSTVLRWENGARVPRPRHARDYAELLEDIAGAR